MADTYIKYTRNACGRIFIRNNSDQSSLTKNDDYI